MRFVSKYKKYTVVFQREIIEHFGTGESHEIKPFVACQFDLYGSMRPYEIEAARKQFINHGLPTEIDGVTTIDPLTRFSVFDSVACQDTYGFDDETREKVEQFLLSRAEYGTDYIEVEEPRLAAPWPTYNDFRGVRGLPTPQAIVKKVVEDGYPIEDVIAFERQNLDRQEVLDALEAATQLDPEEELIEA